MKIHISVPQGYEVLVKAIQSAIDLQGVNPDISCLKLLHMRLNLNQKQVREHFA